MRATAALRLSSQALLGTALLLPACSSTPPVSVTPRPPTPAKATPSPSPTPAPTSIPLREDVQPPLIRVRLSTAAEPLLPDPGRRYACIVDGVITQIRGPLRARLVGETATVQVGAFSQAENAEAVVRRLEAAGVRSSGELNASGLHRVLAVAEPGEGLEALLDRLRGAGFPDVLAPRGGAGSDVVLAGEGGVEVTGAEIRLIPLDPQPVSVGGKSVRGELLLRPGSGGVAVINVLNLEEYLRGVVPAEMGPRAFPMVEALKAQAVAARTYTVAHLGDREAEGWDICDTQACQVYEGADAEHPLSDRAVMETRGEIMTFAGEPVDAMYHSTCGGHTEDGGAVFPERAAPYLRGVSCGGGGRIVVGGGQPQGGWGGSVERLAFVAERLAAVLGVPAQPVSLATRLGGHQASPGTLGLARAFRLDDLVTTVLLQRSEPTEAGLLELLRIFRIPLPEREPDGESSRWELALVVRLAQLAGEVSEQRGSLVPGPMGPLLVDPRSGAETALDSAVAALERRADSWRPGAVAAPAGSPLTLWCQGDRCPVVEIEVRSAADDASAWSWWARERSLAEVGETFGVARLDDVVVTRRGRSGRALEVVLRSRTGDRTVNGYAFRRALDLPDTLFVVLRGGTVGDGELRFLGRGWGHGVGMCQNGAFGMAQGGASYREILAAYYSGVTLKQWQQEGTVR